MNGLRHRFLIPIAKRTEIRFDGVAVCDAQDHAQQVAKISQAGAGLHIRQIANRQGNAVIR